MLVPQSKAKKEMEGGWRLWGVGFVLWENALETSHETPSMWGAYIAPLSLTIKSGSNVRTL